jgi:serine/threonine-protein kinase HipA
MIRVWTDAADAGTPRSARPSGQYFPLPARCVSGPRRFGDHARAALLLGFALRPAPHLRHESPRRRLAGETASRLRQSNRHLRRFRSAEIVGRSQVGRIRYTGDKQQLNEEVPFQSVDEILENSRGGDLYRYLLEKFATFSGISGVQPKVLVRDEAASIELRESKPRISESYRGATHIVKFWDQNEYPQLAANEFFCLQAR